MDLLRTSPQPRAGREIPLERLRPDQGLAAERGPTAPLRPLHAEQEPAKLLRRDRAGGFLPVTYGPRRRALRRPGPAVSSLFLP